MRKGLFVIMVLAFCITLKAQTSLNEAVDFQVTDMNGESIHLFELLDRGQYVLIDFFEADCGGCQQTIPAMVDAFPVFGCNLHDVYFMGISYIDNDSIIEQWQNRFGVDFPTIGVQGGGNEVFTAYKIKICPSFVLINPDHSIAVKAMYPFTSDDLIEELTLKGVVPHDCTIDPCDPPSQLAAEYNNDTVFISWNHVLFANSYDLYRGEILIAHTQDTCFADVDIQESMEYCYSVSTVCDAGLVSDRSEQACVVIPQEYIECDPPENLTAFYDGEAVLLNWETTSMADSYNIYRNDFFIATVVVPYYVDNTVLEDMNYCYSVNAVCSDEESELSDSACLEVLSCKEFSCERQSRIFPNPTSGQVVLLSHQQGEIKVLTVDGRVAYAGRVVPGKSVLDISAIGSGLYIVHIIEANRTTIFQLVVI